jgi:peptidoglycan/xylan/chitin deacetylase (PgdA/CDA1 family)
MHFPLYRRALWRAHDLRRAALSVAALLALAPAFWLSATPVSAASPFPAPATAEQLARNLSPAGNPGAYTSWWTTLPSNSTYAGWFWNDIVPNSSGSKWRTDTANTLWNSAVPNNWAMVADLGGWPWPKGGYYTQMLWLHAIPEGWAPVANIGGWPWASGGYYTQQFWLHAVPDNWAPVGNTGGWPWSRGGYYSQWLWLHAVAANWAPVANIGGWPWPTGGYYTQWFWLHAVPENWAMTSDIGDWSSADGGYYTQWFWLHAIPDNWAATANIGGWNWPSGGYFTQWFWLHAVPDRWAVVGDIGGSPRPTDGYYTQWFWLHAVSDNWAAGVNLSLGHLPTPSAYGDYVQAGQGYYRYWLWEGAIPDNWLSMANIGGWPWATGGYYTQWFWLHAAPDQWATDPTLAIDGKSGAGYFDYTFYHFATIRDFAWRGALSLGGSSGAGYYDYWYHGTLGTLPHYKQLLDVAGGYLANASTFQPVTSWYGPGTQAVVTFTFDTEGAQAETCAVTDVLKSQGVPATFYLVGWTAASLTSGWKSCLSGMDVENHTANHPGGFPFASETLMNTYPDAVQYDEIHGNVAGVRAQIPDATMTSFRTPWCDSSKSFDRSVIRAALASGMTSDRSVATIPDAARQAGVVPPLGLAQFAVSRFPSPFVVGTGSGSQLVEFPYTYPSDWTAAYISGLDPNQAPASSATPGSAIALWEREFDEIYAQHGVMVVLMHPWIQGAGGRYPDGLDQLITYMKAKPGVAFSTATTLNQSYRSATGMPQ